MDELDSLASRYYRLDSGSRERAARDWENLCVKVAKMIKDGYKKPKMD